MLRIVLGNLVKPILQWLNDTNSYKEFWYSVEYEKWFPKCKSCKGYRQPNCPRECLGDQ